MNLSDINWPVILIALSGALILLLRDWRIAVPALLVNYIGVAIFLAQQHFLQPDLHIGEGVTIRGNRRGLLPGPELRMQLDNLTMLEASVVATAAVRERLSYDAAIYRADLEPVPLTLGGILCYLFGADFIQLKIAQRGRFL